MAWQIKYHPLAEEELAKLDGSVRKIVLKGIIKVSANPKPFYEGGYGKPLGNRDGSGLAGLFKIKFRDIGIRVVYEPVMTDTTMKIIIVSARADNQVYKEAYSRRTKNGL